MTGSPTTLGINQMFELQWGTASGSVGYYQVNGSGADTTTSASTHELDVTPLGVGTFSYTVQACNAAGCSGDSNTVRVTVQNGGGSGCPTCPPTSPFDIKGKISPKTKPPVTPVPPATTGAGIASTWTQADEYLGGKATPNAGAMVTARTAAMQILPEQSSAPVAMQNSVSARLVRERQALTADSPAQASEVAMQALANARERAELPSLLPAPATADVAAWNAWDEQWKQSHPNGPEFAPPEYIAYADTKLEPASGSTYRFEVQYNYDPASGGLESVEDAETGFVYWQAAMGGAAPVDAFGHLIGWTDGNNVSTVTAYDAATGVPVGISSGIGQSSAVQSLTYAWDGYGNLTERQDTNQSLTETFGYDDLNRLTGSTVTNPAANGPTLGFGYDAMGNIETKTLAGVTSTYTYDSNHPYAVDSVSNFNGGTYTASYDADGNMVTRNGAAITWTPANLPASITGSLGSSTFNYGPDGNRYYQAETFNGVTTNTTYIAGGLFEVVASTSSTEFRHNILADGQIIAVHTITAGGAASTSYLHYDQLGSMDTITNATGSVIQSMSFDAFGNRRLATSWDYGVSQNTLATMNDYTNRGYTDQEQLDNLSLVDMNGRVYDPTVGRFLSADPTGGSGIGRYTYGMDSPLVYTDPSGFDDCPPANGDPTVKCNAKLQPVTVTAFPPDFGSGDITSGSGSGPGGPVQGSDGGTINLGDVDVNATTTNNNTNNTINLLPVVDTAVRLPPPASYYTLHPINWIQIDWQFEFTGWRTPNDATAACASGLATARQTRAAIARANAAWGTLSSAAQAHGVPTALLAAIGVRETGFQNEWQNSMPLSTGGFQIGFGAGVFQIDLAKHPNVSALGAFNVAWAANYAAGILASNESAISGHFPNFTSAQVLQATADSYNFGVRNISGNPDAIDKGSAGNNYGSDVAEIMTCWN